MTMLLKTVCVKYKHNYCHRSRLQGDLSSTVLFIFIKSDITILIYFYFRVHANQVIIVYCIENSSFREKIAAKDLHEE